MASEGGGGEHEGGPPEHAGNTDVARREREEQERRQREQEEQREQADPDAWQFRFNLPNYGQDEKVVAKADGKHRYEVSVTKAGPHSVVTVLYAEEIGRPWTSEVLALGDKISFSAYEVKINAYRGTAPPYDVTVRGRCVRLD